MIHFNPAHVRATLARLGIRKNDFAKAAGISPAHLSIVLNERRPAGPKSAEAIMLALVRLSYAGKSRHGR